MRAEFRQGRGGGNGKMVPSGPPLQGHPTSIHWHGILLPADMDGVPGLSFNGIAPGEAYQYRFTLKQSGTYWYHSHSMFQEQAGLYGALIIDPLQPAPYHFDREHVILLSDWTDMDPGALFRRMKKLAEFDNYYKRTLPDFLRDVRKDGWAAATADRRMWGRMRMTPTDISDINAHTYTYLLNGTAPAGNWTGLFRSGEKVLLRFINGGSMTYFDVRIPGLKMTVVAADGQYIHPVGIDEFRIAPAETFDVIVEPSGQDAFTIFCQDMGRTGYAAGTLAGRCRSAGLPLQLPGDLWGHHHRPLHHREGDAAVRGLHLQAGAHVEAELVQPAAAQLEVGNNLGGTALFAVRVRQRAYAVGACGAGVGFALGARVIGFVFPRRQHVGPPAGLALAGMARKVGARGVSTLGEHHSGW